MSSLLNTGSFHVQPGNNFRIPPASRTRRRAQVRDLRHHGGGKGNRPGNPHNPAYSLSSLCLFRFSRFNDKTAQRKFVDAFIIVGEDHRPVAN